MGKLDLFDEPRVTPLPFRMPFHLFDLPQELQDYIYCHLYVETYDIDAHLEYSGTTPHRRFHRHPKSSRRLVLYGLPSCNLELACKKTCRDSKAIRRQAFSGCLRILYDNEFGFKCFRVLLSFDNKGFSWLRRCVSEIEFSGFNDDYTQETASWGEVNAPWDLIGRTCSNVRRINVTYVSERSIYDSRHSNRLAQGWEQLTSANYNEHFAAGDKDANFTFPSRLLQLGQLFDRELLLADCKAYLTTTVRWMETSSSCLREQAVDFLLNYEYGHRLCGPLPQIGLYLTPVGRWQDGEPAAMNMEHLPPVEDENAAVIPAADDQYFPPTVAGEEPPPYASMSWDFAESSLPFHSVTNPYLEGGAPPPYC